MSDSYAIKPKGKHKHHVEKGGTATFEYTVSNMGDSTLTTRFQIVNVDPTSAQDWFRLEGEDLRELSPGHETVVQVTVQVPTGAEVGSSRFRVLVNAQEDPEGIAAEGPESTVVVGEQKKKFPIWIPIVAGAVVLVIIAVVLVIVLSGNGDEPEAREARLELDPTEGIAPLTIQFTDLTEGEVKGWQWDFGDGGTSTEPEGSHDYTKAGDFPVKLTVTFADDTQAEVSGTVAVGAGGAPVDFTGAPRVGTVPLTVRFRDLSTSNPTAWTWQFGDDKTDIAQNPTHVYAKAGSFAVTLRIETSGGPLTKSKAGFVRAFNPVKIGGLKATPMIGEAPLDTKLALVSPQGAIKSVTWAFGDVTTVAASGRRIGMRTVGSARTAMAPRGLASRVVSHTTNHRYAKAGKFTAKATVGGRGGDKKVVTTTVAVFDKITGGRYLEAKVRLQQAGLVIGAVDSTALTKEINDLNAKIRRLGSNPMLVLPLRQKLQKVTGERTRVRQKNESVIGAWKVVRWTAAGGNRVNLDVRKP